MTGAGTGELGIEKLVWGWKRDCRGLISETRWSTPKGMSSYIISKGDVRGRARVTWKVSDVRRLNRDEVMEMWRLDGCKDFVKNWQTKVGFFICEERSTDVSERDTCVEEGKNDLRCKSLFMVYRKRLWLSKDEENEVAVFLCKQVLDCGTNYTTPPPTLNIPCLSVLEL